MFTSFSLFIDYQAHHSFTEGLTMVCLTPCRWERWRGPDHLTLSPHTESITPLHKLCLQGKRARADAESTRVALSLQDPGLA